MIPQLVIVCTPDHTPLLSLVSKLLSSLSLWWFRCLHGFFQLLLRPAVSCRVRDTITGAFLIVRVPGHCFCRQVGFLTELDMIRHGLGCTGSMYYQLWIHPCLYSTDSPGAFNWVLAPQLNGLLDRLSLLQLLFVLETQSTISRSVLPSLARGMNL